jgi:hypothetical protein
MKSGRANFALQTGQPVTYPVGKYEILEMSVPSYGLRNENRSSTTILDLAATLPPTKKQE